MAINAAIREEVVVEVYKKLGEGIQPEVIAQQYGIGVSTVYKIKSVENGRKNYNKRYFDIIEKYLENREEYVDSEEIESFDTYEEDEKIDDFSFSMYGKTLNIIFHNKKIDYKKSYYFPLNGMMVVVLYYQDCQDCGGNYKIRLDKTEFKEIASKEIRGGKVFVISM